MQEPLLRHSYCFIRNTHLTSLPAAEKETAAFFEQDEKMKSTFNAIDKTESGYRAVFNKEVFMLNDRQYFPHCIKLAEDLHQIAINCLKTIANELRLDADTLVNLIPPTPFANKGSDSSLLRLNHYRLNHHIENETIISEMHEDIGLLTLVCPTNTPALEIYDFTEHGEWVDVEAQQGRQDILVMAGATLNTITNHYYLPATHRVRRPITDRTSIVYHLRVRDDAILNSQLFETTTTGPFSKPFLLNGREYLEKEKALRDSVNGSY